MDAKIRVLVVDDEPGVLRFVNSSLSMAGFDVVSADSGEEALQLALISKPDIMLLDVLMVPVSGFDVLSQLRTFSQVPVIVFTARNNMGALAIKEGASGFLAKPFKPDELIKKIMETLGKK